MRTGAVEEQPVPAALLGACSGRRPAGMFSCWESEPAVLIGVSLGNQKKNFFLTEASKAFDHKCFLRFSGLWWVHPGSTCQCATRLLRNDQSRLHARRKWFIADGESGQDDPPEAFAIPSNSSALQDCFQSVARLFRHPWCARAHWDGNKRREYCHVFAE